ncbi:MAG: protein phosphatase 2C domain-containing protein [Candidatus Gastranaerophilales bacterium]|nr:protein phosphatase 2C domain-containing protein [Candidatus Gastranaerophilales bacterium]
MSWKYFYSSVKGTSHLASNTPKQDNCEICVFKDCFISTVADGAGSAKYSDMSSKFICKLFVRKTKQWLESNNLENLTREIISEWFSYFQKVINRTVLIYKLESSREFATTLLFSVLSKDFNIFVQIGDGIIAVGDENNMECVFLPQNGEFINTTHFATETNALNIFMYKTTFEPIKYIAMHTDGIEQIALDFKAQKPFIPFFVPFFSALEKLEDSGYSDILSKQLEIFLASDRVNKKTDDDKTLFLASVTTENVEKDNEQ